MKLRVDFILNSLDLELGTAEFYLDDTFDQSWMGMRELNHSEYYVEDDAGVVFRSCTN